MLYLNSAMLRTMHSELIGTLGGRCGLRDAGLLESAIALPLPLANYSPDATGERAAVLFWGLVQNRAFVDGNRRIALAALVTFLRLNGWRLTCSEVEETAMMLRAAASEITEDECTEWVGRTVGRL